MVLLVVLLTLFLGDYMTKSIQEIYSEVQGIGLSNMRWLIDSTTMAGVLMINCVLVPLNVLAIMVQDSTDKRPDSFLVSSVSLLIGSVHHWHFAQSGVPVCNSGLHRHERRRLAGWSGHLNNAGADCRQHVFLYQHIFLGCLVYQNANVYNTLTGIVSALVGFITGVFIPIWVFPDNVKTVFAIFPSIMERR